MNLKNRKQYLAFSHEEEELKGKDFLSRHSFWSSVNFYLKSSWREIQRRKTFYLLALLSCALVVTTTAVAQSVINNAPLIFLKQAERTSGQIDVGIYSHNYGRSQLSKNHEPLPQTITNLFSISSPNRGVREVLLNGTKIEQINQQKLHAHTSYRYSRRVDLLGARDKNAPCEKANEFINSFEKVYENSVMDKCTYKSVDILILNTTRENEIGLGSRIDQPIPEGSAIIDQGIAKMLNATVGDYIWVQFYPDSHIEYIAEINQEYFRAQTHFEPQDVVGLYIRMPVKVHEIWENFADKVPGGGQNIVLMEQSTFFPYAMKYFSTRWTPLLKDTWEFFRTKLSQLKIAEFSNSVMFNHPQRMKVYTDPNYDNLQYTVEKFAEKVSLSLGVLPFDMRLELLSKLEPLKFAVLFLGILLNVVIIVLFGQSVMVIYNLLLVKVETKTFEIGVLRTMGLNQSGIIELILVQTLIFVVPAIGVGLFASVPLLSKIGEFLRAKLDADVNASLTSESALYACLVGMLVPVASSLFPIAEALGKPLNAALDTVHSKATSVFIDIQLSSQKVPWATITFSSLTIAFGMSVYYLLPLSLVSLNFGLMLSIFFWILLGMLFGLVLLSMNVQHLVERIVVKVLLCFSSQSFRDLVVKNLVTHKLRNRKTATMYALTLGFVIFLVVGYQTNIEAFAIVNNQSVGAHVQIVLKRQCTQQPHNGEYLQLDKFLHTSMSDTVDSFSWVTCGLREVIRPTGYSGLEAMNIGRLYNKNADVFGVSPNIFDVTLSEFYKPGVVDTSSAFTPVQDLYSTKGSQSAIVSDNFREDLDLNLGQNSSFLLKFVNGSYSKIHEMRMAASMKMSPSFGFQLDHVVNLLISIPNFMRLAGLGLEDHVHVPMNRLLIKLKKENTATAEATINKIKAFCNEKGIAIDTWNYYELNESLKSNDQAIQGIFSAIEIISMMLCLFSLITTMSSNIFEQSKEIAVLRAIGVNKKTVIRLYCAEAVVLVVASSFLGSIIGAIVGWSMSEQRAIFTKLPIGFQFPTLQMVLIFIIAIISGVLSSYFPAKTVCRSQIAQIVRGTI